MPGPFSLTGRKMPWVRGWQRREFLVFKNKSSTDKNFTRYADQIAKIAEEVPNI
jgi:hypothetical protein